MLDKGSELILGLILAKEPGQVTEEDVKWLHARRSYVSQGDLDRLGVSFDGMEGFPAKESEPEAPAESEQSEPVEAPAKPKAKGGKK